MPCASVTVTMVLLKEERICTWPLSTFLQPIAKRCKALNLSPAAMGYAKKTTNRNPKGQMRKKQSEYFTKTSTVFRPYSIAALAAVSAAL